MEQTYNTPIRGVKGDRIWERKSFFRVPELGEEGEDGNTINLSVAPN
jgi:hypothetical protein